MEEEPVDKADFAVVVVVGYMRIGEEVAVVGEDVNEIVDKMGECVIVGNYLEKLVEGDGTLRLIFEAKKGRKE